jgi:hypothetical protein
LFNASHAEEPLIAFDRNLVRDNHARLAELYRRADPDLLIMSAHDPTLCECAGAGGLGDRR